MLRAKDQRSIPYDLMKVIEQYDVKHKIKHAPKLLKKKKKGRSSKNSDDEVSLFTDNNSYGGPNSPNDPPFAEFGPEDVIEEFDL